MITLFYLCFKYILILEIPGILVNFYKNIPHENFDICKIISKIKVNDNYKFLTL